MRLLTIPSFSLIICTALGAKDISYNKHIQPILSENCFFCHGPDSSSRKPDDAPLRLDLEEFAFAEREDGPQTIIPGDPENSYIIQLMESDDPYEVMPLHPSRDPAHGKVMNPKDIELVKEWIRQGAKYEPHWAYVAPTKRALPDLEADWVKNPIDHFVAAKRQELKIPPNSRQNTNRLLRRLYFDLTGLPPDDSEITAFIEDGRDFTTKYSELVDKLLTTPDYAEHMARYWMDVARYADTQGIHHDWHRTSWPYRDYLIDSFNENKPFDEFTKEQLAGDLYPDATAEQKIATGYLRILATSGEGGLIPEEYEAIYAQDRVDAMSAAWLGLTTNCASCHDHKFDQLSTREVYQFTAFFRNNTMNPLQGQNHFVPPYEFAPTREDRDTYAKLKPRIDKAEENYAIAKNTKISEYKEWKKNIQDYKTAPTHTTVSITSDNTLSAHTDLIAPQLLTISPADIERTEAGNPALALKDNKQYLINTHFNIDANTPFTISFELKISDHDFVGSLFSKMDFQNKMKGWDIWLERGQIGMHMIHEWPDLLMRPMVRHLVPTNKWTTITMSYDGSGKVNGLTIYHDSFKHSTYPNGKATLTKEHSLSSNAPLVLNGRASKSHYTNGASVRNIQFFKTNLNQVAALKLAHANNPEGQLSPQTEELVKEHYFSKYNAHSTPYHNALADIMQEFYPISARGGKSLIYGEKEHETPHAHVLVRGQYASKGAKVYPNVPAVLPPLILEEKGGAAAPPAPGEDDVKPDRVPSRLDLANWLVRSDNPLPSRVIVNRYWSYFFGRGFLGNNADFGAMGGHPSHPALIDWLSRDFIESGWDLHHLLKIIVTSATYQQSPIPSEDAKTKDPENIYLTRGPRFRLDAEQIRDMALSTSGLLSKKIGGKSVKPYQPDGHWHISMNGTDTRNYVQSKGEDLYRRSLYTYWKRQATHPAMDILNAPVRESFCVQREITNTPLQALTLMNEPLFFESCRILATKAISLSSSDDEIIDTMSRKLLSRTFSTAEKEIIQETHQNISAFYQENPDAAQALLTTGQAKIDDSIPAEKLASWTMIASQILNLDEAVTK